MPSHEKPDPPKCPVGLLATSRKIWRELFASPLARAIDVQADLFKLTRWIGAVDEYQRCAAVFRKARLVKGSTGQPVLNPLSGYLVNLEATITRIETEFGMGPLSRMRLGIATGQAALTAEELNRRLDEGASQVTEIEPEAWEAEWETAQ
jgi:P27 family predicted phage terminase small subunit